MIGPSHSSLAATAALSLGAGLSLSYLSSFPGPPHKVSLRRLKMDLPERTGGSGTRTVPMVPKSKSDRKPRGAKLSESLPAEIRRFSRKAMKDSIIAPQTPYPKTERHRHNLALVF